MFSCRIATGSVFVVSDQRVSGAYGSCAIGKNVPAPGSSSAVVDPKYGYLYQPSTVTPVLSDGRPVSLQLRNHPWLPLLPASPVCCHAAEPGWAVTGAPVGAAEGAEDG